MKKSLYFSMSYILRFCDLGAALKKLGKQAVIPAKAGILHEGMI